MLLGGGSLVRTVLRGPLKGGSVQLQASAQSWIVDSNSVWSGLAVSRYNRGIVRWPANWTSTTIQLDAVSTPVSFTDAQFSVVVDGAIQQTFTVPATTVPSTVIISGLTIAQGGSTVEVWEPWCGKPSTQNTGADGPVEAAYVYAIYLPYGGPVLTAPTCTTGIVMVGDSISGVRLPIASNAPEAYYGPGGQLRLLAQAKGWLLTSLDYGGACVLGDGLTAANFITWIQQAVVAMGAPPTIKVLYLPFRNDYADNGTTVSTTPTQGATFLQTIVNGLTAGYQHIVCTPIPQVNESAINGFTLPQWRTGVNTVTGATLLDGTSMPGFSTSTDLYSDGIHMTTSGVAKYVALVRGSLGL